MEIIQNLDDVIKVYHDSLVTSFVTFSLTSVANFYIHQGEFDPSFTKYVYKNNWFGKWLFFLFLTQLNGEMYESGRETDNKKNLKMLGQKMKI